MNLMTIILQSVQALMGLRIPEAWSSRTENVDACFVPTGKVLVVIAKFYQCKN